MFTESQIVEMVKNRFKMNESATGFIDNFSAASVTVSRDFVALSELCSRVLSAWRAPVTTTLAGLGLSIDEGLLELVYLDHADHYPWGVEQKGFAAAGKIRVSASLYSPEYNSYAWIIKIENVSDHALTVRASVSGGIKHLGPGPLVTTLEDGVHAVFRHGVLFDDRKPDATHDNKTATWLLRLSGCASVTADQKAGNYTLEGKACRLEPGLSNVFEVLIDYGMTDHEAPLPPAAGPTRLTSWEGEWKKRRAWWVEKLQHIEEGGGDEVRSLRAAAGLLRCGSDWQDEGIVASCCTVTDWPAMVFFWDSVVSSVGLMRMDSKLGLDAIRATYVRQRPDGCTSASKQQFRDGSTVFPMATIASWAMVQMEQTGVPISEMRDVIASTEKLHQWYLGTQDHDRDGLAEWRFTGCCADDSPAFDRYAPHAGGQGCANYYLPPVASVSLNSYLIMDAKCLAYLYEKAGDNQRASAHRATAAKIEQRLKEVCLDSGRFFFDYDQQLGGFNRALTLYSFLPLWAGVSVEDKVKRSIIEEWLLNPRHFFGDYPFPFTAYSDLAYRPNGYWRGRVWVHTTYWMLELLWSHSYERQADEAADRLLKMMSQREELLENYNSDPSMPGGGQADYNWALASYLQISEHKYRNPVLLTIQ